MSNTIVKIDYKKEIVKFIDTKVTFEDKYIFFRNIVNILSLENGLLQPEKRNERLTELEKINCRYLGSQKIVFNEAINLFRAAFEDSYNNRSFTDILGEIFTELNFSNGRNGKYFTPDFVSYLMAKITLTGCEETLKEKGFLTLNKPCCGSGSTLLQIAKLLYDNCYDPSKSLLIEAVDIDSLCTMMCYVQLSYYGLCGIVKNQNSLTNETPNNIWITPNLFLGMSFY